MRLSAGTSHRLIVRKIKEHSGRIMAVVRLYIDNIHDLNQVSADIEKLGKLSWPFVIERSNGSALLCRCQAPSNGT